VGVPMRDVSRSARLVGQFAARQQHRFAARLLNALARSAPVVAVANNQQHESGQRTFAQAMSITRSDQRSSNGVSITSFVERARDEEIRVASASGCALQQGHGRGPGRKRFLV